MPWEIRQLDAADRTAASTLGREAFGFPAVPPAPEPEPQPDPEPWPAPGSTEWGTFEGDVLVAKAARAQYRSHFGGVTVPTCGVAGVTVAAESRGRGMMAPLLAQVLAHGRDQGDVIATLFASAPGIYRRYGFELITGHNTVEIPATAAAAVAPGTAAVTTRRATAADFDAVLAVYTRWARRQNGPLTRTGPLFPAVDLTREFTGVTLAVDADGEVLGYASWDRGSGEGPDAVLVVDDLIALSADAYRALWRAMGSFASVVSRIQLHASGPDPARLFLGPRDWTTIAVNPYLLRVDDVAGAFTSRRLAVDRPLTFAVAGDRFGVMNGTYELRPDDDGARCVRVSPDPGAGRATYSPGGLALAWAGAQSHANIRMVGGLTGPDDGDAVLDRALGHWPLHIRDGF